MFELKPLEPEAVPAALGKAEHYRLLSEPEEAESICTDVLEVEPTNQRALIVLHERYCPDSKGTTSEPTTEASSVSDRRKRS
jgi:hypothetical protein